MHVCDIHCLFSDGESGYHVSSSLIINQLHQSDNGDYRCSAANTNGTIFSITNITVTSECH